MNGKNVLLLIQFIIIIIIIKNLLINRKYIESHRFNDDYNKLFASFMVNIISYDNPVKFFVNPFLNL